jgi:hypothetical protein
MPSSLRKLLPGLAIVTLALLASSTSIGNYFAQDDIPLIKQSDLVHDLAHPAKIFTSSYWPPPWVPALYRPLTTLGFALQWAVGAGHPIAFRIGSILLYVAVCLAFFGLARVLLPSNGAWVASALFAVHPIHVEAVALGVGQAELTVGLLSILSVAAYLVARSGGAPITTRAQIGLLGLYAAACLFKESGVILPGLFIAAELTLIRDPKPLMDRVTRLRPFYLWCALVAVSLIGVRTLVLGGDVVGSFTAEALWGLSIGGRALTMLGVVPEWIRLMLWPAHLQSDYSPQEIVAATDWGSAQWLGLGILALAVLAALRARGELPVLTFGVLWIAVAIFPVHNVLVPTGIVLAERTLFLPSAGMMLVLGALTPGVVSAVMASRPWVRAAATGTFAVVLLAGAARSAFRQLVWHDQFRLYEEGIKDAPLSYRVRYAYAELMFMLGQKGTAEANYRAAILLYPRGFSIYRDLGDRYRLAGDCKPAMDLYEKALAMEPRLADVRSSLIACLLYVGDYRKTIVQTRLGAAYGFEVENFQQWRHTADSAIAVNAPPKTIRITVDTTHRRRP